MEHPLGHQEEGLKRVIGVKSLAISGVNLTVGAGIFALPAVVAATLGTQALFAYLVCGLLLALVLMCFAEIGSKVTISGGAYSYVEKAFGPLAGFLANTLFWLGFSIAADAAVANVLADNLAQFFPELKSGFWRTVLMLIIFGGAAFINTKGSKESAQFVVAITLIKLIPLLLFITLGWWFVDIENLKITKLPAIANLGEGALLLFFAFGGGIETTLSASGEIKNPVRVIPRGLLLAVIMVLLVYILIQLVAQGVLGDQLPEFTQAPLAAVAETMMGSWGTILFTIAAAFSCYALINGDVFVTSRLPYAAARDGLLPKFLARIHPTSAIPVNAIIFYATVGFMLSISGGFRQLAILSSAAILMVYLGVIAATIKMRKIKVEHAFTVPGGLLIPILAMGSTLWFISNLTWKEWLSLLIFLLFFTLVYFIRKVWISK